MNITHHCRRPCFSGRSPEAVSGAVCHTSLHQLRLSLASGSGSKLTFSLARSHSNCCSLNYTPYPAKAEGVNRHIAWYITPYPWFRSVRWCLAGEIACGDQRRRTGSGSATMR